MPDTTNPTPAETQAAELEMLKALVAEQSAQLEMLTQSDDEPTADSTKTDVPKAAFIVGDESYRFKLPKFRVVKDGHVKDWTAASALEDAAIKKWLVENKRFGIIEPVK